MKYITTSLIIICLLLCSANFYAQNFKFGKVSKEELLEEQHPLEPEANAAILYKEEKTVFRYAQGIGFNLETDVFYRIKIYDAEGFDWATKRIKLFKSNTSNEKISGLKAVTYNLVDGRIEETKLRKDGQFEEEVNEFKTIETFTMPNIKEGSVIEYKYTFISDFFQNINTLRLQETIPINQVEAKFTSPEYFNYKLQQKGYLPIPIKETSNRGKITYKNKPRSSGGLRESFNVSNTSQNIEFQQNTYVINSTNIPSIKREPYAGYIDNYASAIDFELYFTKFPGEFIKYYTTTWEDVAKTIYDSPSFGKQIENTNFLKKEVGAAIANATSNVEKLSALYTYIQQQMTWDGFIGIYPKEGLRRALKDKIGNTADINLLLVALLREAGIEANPVLVSTKNNGIPTFPTISGFNYVIAAATIDGGTVLMDATKKNAKLGLLTDNLLNFKGRLVNSNGASEWINLYPTKTSVENSITQMILDEDLQLTGASNTSFTEQFAYNKGNSLDLANTEDVRKSIEEEYSTIETSDIEVDVVNINEPIKIKYNFETLDGVEEIGGKYYLNPLGHLALSENPFKLEERKFPVFFDYPRTLQNIVTVKVPEGYTVESMPESLGFSLSNDMGKYIYRINQNGNLIQIMRSLSISKPIIGTDMYQNLKKFYSLIVDKEAEKVVLKRI